MKYIGIDYGTKRIGLAVSDDGGSMAFPLTTVPTGPQALSTIHEHIRHSAAQTIVIGESLNLSGGKNDVQEDIEQFKKDIEEVSGLPAVYEQELFSSSAAARQFAPDGSRKEHPSQDKLDASAAALILQSYLDKMKNNGAN